MNSVSGAVKKYFSGQTETADRATESILTTTSEKSCIRSIVILDTNIQRREPLNKPVTIFLNENFTRRIER